MLVLCDRSWANEEISINLPGGAQMEFVRIESGTFVMGSPVLEEGRLSDEGPQHFVTISQGYYLGKFEVTQGQWESVMGNNPSQYVGVNRPVDHVSWYDAQSFIHMLNETVGDSLYRLPTEAEWEYAARAGTTTRWSFGDDENQLEDYAWFEDNYLSTSGTKEAGTKLPNPWGLYDMHGNIFEWCQDWFGLYNLEASIDPTGPASGRERVIRGGFYGNYAEFVRSTSRSAIDPAFRASNFGFRLLRIGPAPTAIVRQRWGNIKKITQ